MVSSFLMNNHSSLNQRKENSAKRAKKKKRNKEELLTRVCFHNILCNKRRYICMELFLGAKNKIKTTRVSQSQFCSAISYHVRRSVIPINRLIGLSKSVRNLEDNISRIPSYGSDSFLISLTRLKS